MGDPSAEIAGAAANFLLQNLKDLLVEQAQLISGAKNQVEQLEKDVRFLKDFLIDHSENPRQDSTMRRLLRDIRDGVYEAEDIIDAFVTQAVESKSKIWLLRAIQQPSKLLSIAKRVQSVCGDIRRICDDVKNTSIMCIEDGGLEEYEAPKVRQDNVVGFEHEAKQIMEYLVEETQQLDIISIIGTPGVGKTTLAGMIFHDPAIQKEFPIHIWVYVSDHTKKNVLLAILRELGAPTEGMYHKSYEELGQQVAAHLQNVKFLIVMDDVWAAEDWRKLQIAFPKSNKMGKVLITSHNTEVARIANPNRPAKDLRPLSQEDSWRLLQLQVFGKPECPPELQRYGKLIAEQCDGLPLSIVVIGDILAKKVSESDEMSVRKDVWKKVSNSVSTYLSDDDPTRHREKSVLPSYNKLPYHLRACFLYLGMFPEDFDIPVSTLIRMWIAEGLIQQKEDLSLEETAENYLAELISRSLVRVEKKKPTGKAKTCRIPYLLRDFCKTQAGNERENFLQEMKKSSTDGAFQPPISDIQKYRRLCVRSNVSNFISSKPRSDRVRSFVCFSRAEINMETEDVSTFPAAFKLLRVLDAKPIKFTKIPGDLFQLVHLRYVTLSFDLAVLPAAFSKLWNIQTLIVYTTSRTLEIKGDILKMIQLRHLKTNASATLPKPSKSSKEGERLQTLGSISPTSCTEELFDRACNLKKLSIRGRLALLLDGKHHEPFHILGKLAKLEKLKLLNDVHPNPPSQGKLRGLPQLYQFPPKLRRLTLSATYLDWSNMAILGLLPKLEVLKLKDDAFVGRSWEAADGGFGRLEVLQIIGCTDFVVWLASAKHFPKLKRLELWNCDTLKEVPVGLADIPTLQLLQLCNCTNSAAASAKKIGEAKQKKQEEQTTKVSVFKLSILQ